MSTGLAQLAWAGRFRYARQMVTVLIETLDDEEALALTLASLVGAVVEGLVREVIVVDRGSSDQTARVAEHAGCALLDRRSIADAVARARSDWLLLLEPGARPVEGWTEDVRLHMARPGAQPATFSRARVDRAPFLSRVFSGNRALAEGLLIQKTRAIPLARNASGAEALARGLASRKLGAEIRVAPSKA